MARKTPTPEPISINIVCSLCGEPWHLHKAKNGEVTTLECIRLLKAKAVARPVVIERPVPYPSPYPVPYYPHPWPHRWYGSGTYSISSGNVPQTNSASYQIDSSQAINCASSERTPRVLAASAVQ